MLRMNAGLAAMAVAGTFASLPVSATVVLDYNTFLNYHFTPQTDDLLQTDLQSVSSTGDFQAYGAAGTPVLYNGTHGNSSPHAAETAFAGNGYSLTFVLSDAGGYNISSVTTYAGWDTYRGGQRYTLQYDTVFDPGVYASLGTVNFDEVYSGANVNTRVIVADNAGPLATGVRSVRFNFVGVTADLAAYREIDVVGTHASVPEPVHVGAAALGLLVLAGGRLLVPRRGRA